MTDLQADIARIAAMRGRSPNDYNQHPQSLVARHATHDRIGQLFYGNPDPRDDLGWYDDLPAQSRRFIANCPLQLNCGWWNSLLVDVGEDEDGLIDAVQSHIPGRVNLWILRHYDAGHPSTRKAA